MRAPTSVVLGLFLLGCSGGAVPKMAPSNLSAPRMQGLEPRTIAVKVVDRRDVSAEDKEATEASVAKTFGDVFGREGVNAEPNSPNVLTVSLKHPSKGMNDIDPRSCIEMASDLTFADGRSVTASATGCAEFRNGFGMKVGENVTGAFEYAANQLLRYFDESYSTANTPLVFEATQLKIPEFTKFDVSALRLTVKDTFDSDGALGKNLATELTAALEKAGIDVDEKAPQTLEIVLSTPENDFAGRSKTTCLAIELNARLKRGTTFSHGTSCRGLAETNHHRILNQALAAMLNEYARLGAH